MSVDVVVDRLAQVPVVAEPDEFRAVPTARSDIGRQLDGAPTFFDVHQTSSFSVATFERTRQGIQSVFLPWKRLAPVPGFTVDREKNAPAAAEVRGPCLLGCGQPRAF